jgi:hypothetical protein
MLPNNLEDPACVCGHHPMAIGDFGIAYFKGNRFFFGGLTLFDDKTKPVLVQFDNLLKKKEITRIDFRARLG